MPVTIYRSTDAGAPTYPASSLNGAGASAVMDIFKACLVDGFGSKPGAGWTIDYEDTTAQKRRIAFSNGNGVFEMVTWGTYGLGFFIWDSITTPGAGAIYTDPWASVVSEGVNGWRGEREAADSAESNNMAACYASSYTSSNQNNYAWTVFADDKSAWILFHYGEGTTYTEITDSINGAKGPYHLQLFLGALKSPDLGRSDAGNFFMGYGGNSAPTSASPTGGSNSNMSYFWGLRTPMGTLPSTGAGSDFEIDGYSPGLYMRNPVSSMRPLLPAMVCYDGADVPNPTGLTSTYRKYTFAAFPGICQLGEAPSSTHFWNEYNKNRQGDTDFNLEEAVIGGYTWMPWSLGAFDLYECGITDHADWW